MVDAVSSSTPPGEGLGEGLPAGAVLQSAVLGELPVGIWVAIAPSGELAYANDRFAEILGMGARDDVAAGEYAEAYRIVDRSGRLYPEDRLPFAQALRERCTVVVDDIVIERPDGGRAYIRAFGKPLFDSAGEVSHVVVAFIDISAEVHAQREGEKTRAHLETALHHAPIILFAADNDGVITVSEGAALAGLGAKSGELIGLNVFDLYRDDPAVLASTRRALAGESFTTTSHHGPTTLESWLGPLRDEAGAISGYIGVSTDVTERLRLQRQMTHADRMTVLGRLAASVAHEINNPLTYAMEAMRVASGIVDAIAESSPELSKAAQDLRQLLGSAHEGVERVRLITRDLKAFSRPDQDTRAPVLIDEAVQAAARLVMSRTGTHARMQLDLRSGATVHADENRLVQVFSNLLLNASDALPIATAAGNVIRVSSRVECNQARDEVVVEVADNGPGVPLPLREQVFEPFFTTKPSGVGTGLGLHLTRTLIHALGGSVALGDAPEGGALFTVRLLRLVGVAPDPAQPQGASAQLDLSERASTASAASTASYRPRVLIVDDEAMITRVFTASLEDRCEVEIASSGRAALKKLLTDTRYDFIFCDLMMSDLGGAQLYDALRTQKPGREREIVFMTGGVYDPDVADFLAGIQNRCLDKPFDIRREVLGS